MTKILVTGATGFLGGAVVRSLSADGVDVIATGRNHGALAALPLPPTALVSLDLANAQAVRDSIDRFKDVSAIVHCAALSAPWGPPQAFHSANVTVTENVVALGEALGVDRLVQISTPALYFRFADQLQVAEDMELPKPVNSYAATKAMAEDRVRAASIRSVILRPRGIYGAGDTALVPRLLRAAKSGPLPCFRQGQAKTDITHVSDVVAAIRAALSAPGLPWTCTLNISGGIPLLVKDVVDQVCAIRSVPVRWKTLPLSPTLAAVRLAEAVARLRPAQPEPRVTAYGLGIFAYSQTLDLSAAKATLGWAPKMTFSQGLVETFADAGDR